MGEELRHYWLSCICVIEAELAHIGDSPHEFLAFQGFLTICKVKLCPITRSHTIIRILYADELDLRVSVGEIPGISPEKTEREREIISGEAVLSSW